MAISGKKIWITGASSGLGEILAKELGRENELVLIARNQEKLLQINQIFEGRHKILPLDLGKEASLDVLKEFIASDAIPDLVFLNAGVTQRALARDTEMQVFYKVMDINFFGAIGPAQLLLQAKRENQKIHFVVTNSVAGKFGYWLRSGYAASKHALTGYFDVLALEEYRRGVRVTQVFPGRISTPINDNAIMADGSVAGGSYGAFRNAMQPEKVVKKILRAVKRERKHVVIAQLEWIPFIVYRISKGLFFKIFSGQKPE